MKILFRKISISIVLSIMLVSYTEKAQMDFFMPLRDFLYVPDKVIGATRQSAIEVKYEGVPYKASKSGYYVNPYEASSLLKPISKLILEKGCENIASDQKKKLESFARYFISAVEIRSFNDKEFAVWPYPIPFNYNLKPGWISALAQSNISLVFAAASICAGDSERVVEYTYFSRASTLTLAIPIAQGGALVKLNDDNWYEEYAQPGVEPPRVLNGHNYVLEALHSLREYDMQASALFDSGLRALINNIDIYDIGLWSYYDSVKNPANLQYQKTHARQMKELYDITGEKILYDFYRKFIFQQFSPISSIQRFCIKPSRFLGFLLVIDFCVFLFIVMFSDVVSFLRVYRKE